MSSVIDNTEAERYELELNGEISVANYQLQGNNLVITYVGVPPALRGQGVAAKLMDGVVADARQRGLKIIPICSYAAAYMQRHAEA